MENREREQEKGKQKVERGNRQVLGDIGNLEESQITRSITRNFQAKLSLFEKAEAAVASVLCCSSDLEGPANDLQGNQNVDDDWGEKPKTARRFSIESENQPVDMDVDDNQPDDMDADDNQPVDIDADDNQPVDIDADDANNNLAEEFEYLDELYNFHKLTEENNRIIDYMESQREINARMRVIVVNWLVDVQLGFEFTTETLFLTINIMDRYLSLTNNVTKKTFQLVAVCSMSLASKFEEVIDRKDLNSLVNNFLDISVRAYNLQQFISMERDIIEKIQWNLTVPTPYVFLLRLIRASIVEDQEMENMASYIAELGLLHYQVVLFAPSMIAAAAVYSARCTLNRFPYWTENLEYLTGYCREQMKECATLLVRILAATTNNKSLYWKYSSPDKGQISLFPLPHNIEERL